MSVTLLHTVEQTDASKRPRYGLYILRLLTLLAACAFVVLSADRVNACDGKAKTSSARDPSSTIESISVTQNLSCDFNCSANTETSGDLYACERAQQRCEMNAHLPMNTQKVGRN